MFVCGYCGEEFDEPYKHWYREKLGDWWHDDFDLECPWCGNDHFEVVKDEEDENEEDDQADQDSQPRGVA